MVECKRPTLEDCKGLLESKQEYAFLIRVLSWYADPITVRDVREEVRWRINALVSQGMNFPYEITDPLLNLGLRRLKRFGLADRRKTGWELTDQAYEFEGEIIGHAQSLTEMPLTQ